MNDRDRGYIFHRLTESLCPNCLKKIVAKIIIEEGRVYMTKKCEEHGNFKCLIEEDAEYYLSTDKYNKPGTKCKIQTEIKKGCPYDCGICPDHEQYSCINLIDITEKCNLGCPTCYASSGQGSDLSLDKIEKMMDFAIDSEYDNAEILQISGGEPTMHPEFIEIIKLAKEKKFKYVMLNTNGIKIAEDETIAKKLGELKGRFEVYLQFDGFRDSVYKHFRGRDMVEIKRKAIRNLAKWAVPITLVVTVEKGVNDKELGDIVRFGLETKYIRGINFQPVTFSGRISKVDPIDRVTLSGVINRIEDQSKGILKKSDFIPLPCHPDKISITYLFKEKDKFEPITRKIDVAKYLSIMNNTIYFKTPDLIRESVKGLWSASTVMSSIKSFKDFSCCVPLRPELLSKEERIKFVDENTFRISIVQFMDGYNFDIKSIKQDCVHFLTEDFKKIPFSSYNLLYRNKTYDK